MKTFSAVSSALLAATILALFLKPAPHPAPIIRPVEEFRGVAYRSISVDGSLSCRMLHRKGVGTEASASALGRMQIRLACGERQYWFWMAGYDPRRYHYSGDTEPFGPRLIPPLRPSFFRWAINQDKESSRFQDGEYTVDIRVEDGLVTSQRYTRDGVLEMEVLVTAYQESMGFIFPAMAVIRAPGRSADVEVNMGAAEANPEDEPNLSPPDGMKGSPLPL